MSDGVAIVFDLQALNHNLASIRRAVGNQEVIACLKANAYGHGLETVAHFLENRGVRWFSVATVSDALALRESGIKSRILLFPIVGARPYEKLSDAGITISIQSYREAQQIARDVGRVTSVFLKIDSGLGRLGASTTDAAQIVRSVVSELPSIRLEGVFTHLPFSHPHDIPWVQSRLSEFADCVAKIRDTVDSPVLVQALASSGIVAGLEVPLANAVSPGQLLYGLKPSRTLLEASKRSYFDVKPVLKEIRTSLGAIRKIPSDSRYGFGGELVTHRQTRLAVVPVGFSNSLLVPRAGQTANVLGHTVQIVAISLEHAVLDITDVPDANDGCPVILLSRDSVHGLTLEEVAIHQNRSPVELLVSLTGKRSPSYVGSCAAELCSHETS